MKSKTKIKKQPTKGIERIKKLGDSLKGPNSVRVGLPKGSNDYPDGTSVILVGSVHEFGSPSRHVPQRSFLRSTLQDQRRKYKGMFKKLSQRIVDQKGDKKDALRLLGLQAQSDVVKKLTDIKDPPLQHRKGNPLIDTGHLRQSITFEVGDD